jgi:hypothetical protein
VGIEDQIAYRLQRGASPRQLMAEGFKKSTVYKVLDGLSTGPYSPAPSSLFSVQMSTDKPQYLPGTAAQATFSVTNHTAVDLYVFQAGARPEWVNQNEWIATTVRKLLSAGASMNVRLSLGIPPETTLGEKDILFGIYGQWVGPQASSPSAELMWTNPMLLRVQRPPSGLKVFVSHSVSHASLVAQLESTLDDNGITAIPNDSPLDQKTSSDIDKADIVVAVITESSRMAIVLDHVDYARVHNKELILLVAAGLAVMLPPGLQSLRWIGIDFGADAGTVLTTLFNELDKSISNRAARQKEQSDAMGVILVALGALVAGAVLGRGKANP